MWRGGTIPDMKAHALIVLLSLSLASHLTSAAGASAQDTDQATVGPVDSYIQFLKADPQAAVAATERARDAALQAWPTEGNDALIDAVEHHAIAEMAASMSEADRVSIAELWASHPDFVGALARVFTESNNDGNVLELARGIAEDQAEPLADYPQLAAAICVVLDRPHRYPGLGAIRPSGVEVFGALVYAYEDQRVMALDIGALPAEILVFMTDIALTGQGIEQTIDERRSANPLALYRQVPYKQAGLLAGEAAPEPEDFTFQAIADRGGLGPLRSFYAEQIGQIFGWPVSVATGRLGDERFQAPVFLEYERRRYAWNLEAIPDHPSLAFGTAEHPVTLEPMPLSHLVATADLAKAGTEDTRAAWALLRASQETDTAAGVALLKAAQELTQGFSEAWPRSLAADLQAAEDEPTGPQRVLTEFFDRTSEISPMLATQVALETIGSLDGRQTELLEWLALTSRRDPHRYAAAQLALGDAALESGDRDAATKAYEELLNRQADATPLAMDALARLEALLTQDGSAGGVMELYGRTHRRLRAPRTSQEAQVRASAFMVVGERYEQMLRDAGRTREADRLRQQLDREMR